jgi:carotenoid cleavage dioxygenase-like enzyme
MPSFGMDRSNAFSVVSSSFTSTTKKTKVEHVGFESFVSDAPDEVRIPKSLPVQGYIPEYVVGNLIRNGGGIWSIDSETMCGNIIDGLAKLSHYSIDGQTNSVEFMSRFVSSKLYDEWVTNGNAVPTLHIGPIVDKKTMLAKPQKNWFQAALNFAWFDNTPVNVWDFSPPITGSGKDSHKVCCLTDMPMRAIVDMKTGDTIQTAKQPLPAENSPGIFEVTGTAHPEYCKSGTGSSYNIGTKLAYPNLQLCLTKETPDGIRAVIGQYPLRDNKIPFIHSFGLTPTKAVAILQPLRQGYNIHKIFTDGFMSAVQEVDKTKVIVWDLESGEVLADTILPENVFFFHTVSATDDFIDGKNAVSVRVCGYTNPDIAIGPDCGFTLATTKEGRNRIPKVGTICDITVELGQGDTKTKADKAVASVQWIPIIDTCTNTQQFFEMPTTRYSRTSNGNGPWSYKNHPRYVYGFGTYAYGSSDYDSQTIYKVDTVQEWAKHSVATAVSFQEDDKPDSCYYSECTFVPDPNGTDEDDGVILVTRMYGRTEQTSLLVIDAKTMTKVAEAETGIRVPVDFHGGFFPNTSECR